MQAKEMWRKTFGRNIVPQWEEKQKMKFGALLKEWMGLWEYGYLVLNDGETAGENRDAGKNIC